MLIRSFCQTLIAEAYVHIQNNWGNRLNVISEVVNPGIYLAAAYYTYKPFSSAGRGLELSGEPLGLFLLVGFLGFTIYQTLLISAMRSAQRERFGGTLEMKFMTPANRMALLLGAATAGVIRVIYLYVAFGTGAALFSDGFKVAHPAMLVVVLAVIVVPAVAWGTLLNAYLIFARDVSAYVSLLQPLLAFFSGVRFPVSLLPFWIQRVASVIPLYWSIEISRTVLIQGGGWSDVTNPLARVMFLSLVCLFIAARVAGAGERLAKERGTLVVY